MAKRKPKKGVTFVLRPTCGRSLVRLVPFVALAFVVACGDAPTRPTTVIPSNLIASPPPAPATSVSVLSRSTGLTTQIAMAGADPQPPSCAWRDLVVAKHIARGGAKNDIVTLANLHQVYIVDTGEAPGYRLTDVPRPWCLP